jgi:hypothetical protein
MKKKWKYLSHLNMKISNQQSILEPTSQLSLIPIKDLEFKGCFSTLKIDNYKKSKRMMMRI